MRAAAAVLAAAALCAARECREGPEHPWLATKTPYRAVSPGAGLPPPASPGRGTCTPAAAWGLARHGTRYPSREAIVRMGPELEALRARVLGSPGSRLCPEERALLGAWRLEAGEEQAKELHAEGGREMEGIGERLQASFPDLLGAYSKDKFTFRATSTQRAVESGRWFARGLAGRPVEWEEPLRPHDPLIRSYKLCARWRTEVKKNPASLEEKVKFEASDVMETVRQDVSAHLGLEPALTLSQLDLLYVTCNFDLAWRAAPGPGPWCTLFTEPQLQALEYREDLEYYWVDGPGHPVNGAQSCGLMVDLLDRFGAPRAARQRGAFYFSHSGALLKFLAFLGIYEDAAPLRSDNYAEMRDSRKWRTSKIGPFAGNVVFVLLECGGDEVEPTDDPEEQLQVVLYVNEEETAVTGCGPPGGPCTLAALRRLHGGPCRFEAVCRVEEGGEQLDGEVPDDKY